MRKASGYVGAICALAVVSSTGAAFAGGGSFSNDDGSVTISGSVGVLSLKGDEIVYDDAGDPTVVSHLFWYSTSPVLTSGLNVKLPQGWTFDASAKASMGGIGYMEDYDWIDPASYDFDDWSDRSQHPDTSLDWYFNGSILVGRDFMPNDNVTVNLNGGVQYTNVQWTAYGGSYVYSSGPGSPRDQVGDFPDGEKGITLNQYWPALVAGFDTTIVKDAWTFGLSAHGGVTVLAGDVDNHWQRTDGGPEGIRFEDYFRPAPTVSASASAGYQVGEGLNLFVAGSFDGMFTARGDTNAYNQATDDLLDVYPDGAGGALLAASVTVGLNGKF